MSEKPKIFSKDAPSDAFESAFSMHSSGCRSTCECGRECFDASDNGWDWESGEFERLIALSTAEPDHYVALPYACSRAYINGREFVMGCPCNGLRPYQDFIDAYAEQIAKYLNSRAQELARKAEATKVA